MKDNYITPQRVPLPDGVTLRDYFAAAAITGLLANERRRCDPDGFAGDAYMTADAMMAARERK